MRLAWAVLGLLAAAECAGSGPPPPQPGNRGKTTRDLAPCQACRLFVASFRKAMDDTTRGKFEGGDAAWEEEKLGSYARSEVRLVEIQERLCSEAGEHRDRCHAVAEIAETHIEEWWFEKNSKADDLFDRLCVDRLKNCCPLHHYGENCTPCKGGIDNPCGGNGKCKGDGTRKGNGECACDYGYDGDDCQSCMDGFYESYRDEKKMVCSPCHKACEGSCSGGGVNACAQCAKGWRRNSELGCVDFNECTDKNACEPNHFCVNSEGSFKCLKCDKSCDGCTGDGPDMCNRCGAGYQLKDDLCVDSSSVEMSRKVTTARYLTYLGLCITICIIFQKSTMLAGFLGLLVAAYITVSEYMLANEDAGQSEFPFDLGDIDLAKLLGRGS